MKVRFLPEGPKFMKNNILSDIETVVLKKAKLLCSSRINADLVEDDIKVVVGYVADDLIARLTYTVWEGSSEYISVRVPENWFESLKLAHFPKWFKNKWPVRYKNLQVSVVPYFPALRRIAEDHSTEIRFRLYEPFKILA